jgi:hypothetical protein
MPRTLPALLKERLPEAGTHQVLLMSLIGLFTWLQSAGFCQDTTCGIVWDQPILLSDTTYDAHSPKVALSGDDTVHVTWESGGTALRLPYRRSVTGGMNFGDAAELLVDSLSFPHHANWVQMVAEGPRVFVFFQGSNASFTPVRIISSTNSGETWGNPLDISPDSCGEVRSVAVIGDTMGVVYSPEGIKKILRSTDGGRTWTRTNENLNYFARISLSPGGMLHLVQHGGPTSFAEVEYRQSTDLGNSWTQQRVISEIDAFYSDLPALGTESDSVVVTAWRESKLGCSTIVGCGIAGRWSIDGGDNFGAEMRFDTQPAGVDASVAALGNTVAVAWTDDLEGNAKTRVSLDKGQTWCEPMTVSQTGGGLPGLALSRTAVHVVWFGGNPGGGQTLCVWYRRGRFIMTDVLAHKELPSDVRLNQNYPNPFNPNTRVAYEIHRRTHVTLRVHDLLGREIATLVNETKEPGEYTVEWTAGDLPSGVYFYRLIAGDRMETRKAILAK